MGVMKSFVQAASVIGRFWLVLKECGSYPARLQPASEEAYRPLFSRQQGAVIPHGEEASNVKA
jgi:hypothetical protein